MRDLKWLHATVSESLTHSTYERHIHDKEYEQDNNSSSRGDPRLHPR